MVANQVKMTDVLLPALENLTPNGSCYLNEGDFRQPDFQSVFYGANYGRLKKIRTSMTHIICSTLRRPWARRTGSLNWMGDSVEHVNNNST